jgi:hypothetical protein
MIFRRTLSLVAVLLSIAGQVRAFPTNGCEQQRAMYPKDWNDVSHEMGLFDCTSHYSGSMRIKISATNGSGLTLMSLVPLTRRKGSKSIEDPARGVYRIWLDPEQLKRLMEGKYFATVVRTDHSCWIRGDLDRDPILFMDNAKRVTEDATEADPFYGKAPRISAFNGDAYTCKRIRH